MPRKVRPVLLAAASPANNPEYRTSVGYLLNRVPQPSRHGIFDEILGLGRFGVNVHAFVLNPQPGETIQGRLPGAAAICGAAAATDAVPPSPFVQDVSRNIVWGTTARREGDVVRDLTDRRRVRRQAQWIAQEVVAKRIGHLHAEIGAADVAREVKALTGVGYSLAVIGTDDLPGAAQASLHHTIGDADFVIAPGNISWKRLLTATDPGAARKILRMYPGVDLDRLEFQSETGRDPNSVLAVLPLTEGTGVRDLIDAMAVLRHRRIAAVRLTIVGEGELEPEVRTRIASLGLGQCVTVLADVAPARLLSLMRTHAVMALPYDAPPEGDYSDGVPTVLLESMAVGLPIVSTPVTGVSEVIEDGWTGRLVAPRDHQWLAGALETLLDNPQVRVRLANRARQAVERRFALTQNVSVLAGLFANATMSRGRSRRIAPATTARA